MKTRILSRFLALSGLLAASAGLAGVSIDRVFVDDAGNADDSTGFGTVSYAYHVSM